MYKRQALTRGKAVVRVGVIHPIESYWLHWGPSDQTADIRQQMDENFENVTEWLLFGGIDFDYICESQLPFQCPEGKAPLQVGEMSYDAVDVYKRQDQYIPGRAGAGFLKGRLPVQSKNRAVLCVHRGAVAGPWAADVILPGRTADYVVGCPGSGQN